MLPGGSFKLEAVGERVFIFIYHMLSLPVTFVRSRSFTEKEKAMSSNLCEGKQNINIMKNLETNSPNIMCMIDLIQKMH